ncbi:MAG: amino acid aminotransferase [Algisphaera sp.]
MFEHVKAAAPDPILGLSEAFGRDERPGKINLAVGVFKDAQGRTPVLESVRGAERRLVEEEQTKSYMPIGGSPAFAAAARGLLLGADHPLLEAGRVVTFQTPGGTGALRVVGDYLKQNHFGATLWVSDPTWANHHGIFGAAGLTVKPYPYLDPETNGLNIQAMLGAAQGMKEGDVWLLHGCCHNPTGVDPTPDQWAQIAAAAKAYGVLPLVDFAYQGFGAGLTEDATGLRILAETCPELLVCSSYSKNFGLYRERIGALSIIAADADTANRVGSQVKTSIRRNYSNPPAHGGEVVRMILEDPALRTQWEAELTAMRERIQTMRTAFQAGLDERDVSLSASGNGFVSQQNGMFTMSGLNRSQVDQLREDHAIYIVGSGRINVAGITPDNLGTLCDAIAAVTDA